MLVTHVSIYYTTFICCLLPIAYQSADDDFALMHWGSRADGRSLCSASSRLGALLDSSHGRLGSSSLGSTAAATIVSAAALTAGLGDVLERLVELGRHDYGGVNR